MNFINITNSQFGWDCHKPIQALRILDNMLNNSFFMIDPADIHTMLKNKTTNIRDSKLKRIDRQMKVLYVALIHHELNKNGFRPETYKTYLNLHEYVDQLLHQICFNKQRIYLNWKTMNVNILKEYSIESLGYIGYTFLKSLFCHEAYEGIDLYIFTASFPQLQAIRVHN